MDPRKLGIVVPLFLILLGTTGCVQRRFIVNSQPEGAAVTIDQQPVGRTPLAIPFTYTGTREFKLEKDGYQTIKVQENIKPNWYESFPISLVTENFWPREIRDNRQLEFQMQPRTQVQENLLLDRANELRGNVQRGMVTSSIN